MNLIRLLLLLAINIYPFSNIFATIRNVPSDYPTIQAGIDAAVDGDTVLVADGTYTGDGNRDMDFLGKAIVVMSENGPESCIIDCEGSETAEHRGFYFHSSEDSTSVLSGFTIINGWIENGHGAGIYCYGSSPIIIGNLIDTNFADYGGGISCRNSSARLIGNTVTNNGFYYDTRGGGVYCDSSSLIITGNTIRSNAGRAGGGIWCSSSSIVVEDNIIEYNDASNDDKKDGGGIRCGDSNLVLTGNYIHNNWANEDGGGVAWWGPSATIIGNWIINNEADGSHSGGYGGGLMLEPDSSLIVIGNIIAENGAIDGGGIYVNGNSALFQNNRIENNEAWNSGGIRIESVSQAVIRGNTIAGNIGQDGAVSASSSMLILDSNTFSNNNNQGGAEGGGLSCDISSAVVLNTIFWENPDELGHEIAILYSSTLSIMYSLVMGDSNSVLVDQSSSLDWGPGIVDGDPHYVLPDKYDYRLLWDSPCIDTGHPDSLDADGTHSDIGAHYFNQLDYLTLYITPDRTAVAPGGELGVTYTAINRWEQPEPFWALSQVLLPGGSALNVLGPKHYTLPTNYTTQVHITHPVPNITPTGLYEYWSRAGVPPEMLYDDDSFKFWVIE